MFTLQRTKKAARSTLGEFLVAGRRECFTLEDQFREGPKVKHETRIPAGRYLLKLRKIGESRFDPIYGPKFAPGFHQGMVEITGVPGFTDVLIHIGNFIKDTSGCVMVGTTTGTDANGDLSIGNSKVAYQALYPKLIAAIRMGETWIDVLDERAA